MRSLSFLLTAGALAICAASQLPAQQPAGAAKAAANQAIQRANLDTTCEACTDFYTFANGGWLKRASIPAAYPEWGAFEELQDKNEAVVRSIEETDAKAVAAGNGEGGDESVQGRRVLRRVHGHDDDREARHDADRGVDGAHRGDHVERRTAGALTALEKSDGLAPFGVGAGQDFKNSNRRDRQRRSGRAQPAGEEVLHVDRYEHAAHPRRVRHPRDEHVRARRRERHAGRGRRQDGDWPSRRNSPVRRWTSWRCATRTPSTI